MYIIHLGQSPFESVDDLPETTTTDVTTATTERTFSLLPEVHHVTRVPQSPNSTSYRKRCFHETVGQSR